MTADPTPTAPSQSSRVRHRYRCVVDVRIFPNEEWAEGAAGLIGDVLPGRGNVVITGGGSAAKVYPALAERRDPWDELEIFFSDERSVPPTAPDSNYRLAIGTLLGKLPTGPVHRIRGEESAELAAEEYVHEVAGCDMDLMILGLGADGHVAALFPGAKSLQDERLCVAVERPDGMRGVTLTPPVLLDARKVIFIVTGESKAPAVKRAVQGTETPDKCPARLFASHPDVVLLLDDAAAAEL